MVLNFSWLPPEINSALIFGGAGSGSLLTAAQAWDGLAQDLQASAESFGSVLTQLANGPWTGPASVAMAAAAAPYVSWLNAAAGQAGLASAQAALAATAFEAAQSATVPPAAVTANRVTLASLVATNILGQNTPAIFATEFQYVEMWAQDVGAMLGYYSGATTVASTLTPFSVPPISLPGLDAVSSALAGVSSAGASLGSQGAALVAAAPVALSAVESVANEVPLSSVTSVAQIAMYPASMMISPMMSLAQMGAQGGNAGAAGLGAAGLASAEAPKMVGDLKPLGGAGGLGGGGMTGGLGQARLVGAMSVPPTWQGSMPGKMASAAMSGLGEGAAPAAAMAGSPTGGGMPMMPMPMGGMGAGAGAGGPLGRGGASPHVTQNRPSVIPRTGVG